MAKTEEIALTKKALVEALHTSRNQIETLSKSRSASNSTTRPFLGAPFSGKKPIIIGAFCLACAGTLLIKSRKVRGQKKRLIPATTLSAETDQKKVFHWMLAVSQPAAKALITHWIKKKSS